MLGSKNVSLACAIFNGIFCIWSLIEGNFVFGIICAAFCGWCYKNYIDANKI